MLTTLTILIGAYVFTRMVDILVRDGGIVGKFMVSAVAMITLVLAIFVIWDAITRGVTTPAIPPFPPR